VRTAVAALYKQIDQAIAATGDNNAWPLVIAPVETVFTNRFPERFDRAAVGRVISLP
jgi:hypothetical protein